MTKAGRMTKKDVAKAEGRLARLEETLTFIRTQYTEAQKAHAADWILGLQGEAAYLRGVLEG